MQEQSRENVVRKDSPPLFDVGMGWEIWLTANKLAADGCL
jgi:hypothetical protein